MPVGFPTQAAGVVSLYRVPEFTGKGKGDSVMGEAVFQNEQFRSKAGGVFPVYEHLSDGAAFFEPLFRPKPERGRGFFL